MSRFVSDQEEELTYQQQAIDELKQKSEAASEYDQLQIGAEISDEQDRYDMLNKTLVGQRRNLLEREEVLSQHRAVLLRRQGQATVESPVANSADLEPVLEHIDQVRQQLAAQAADLEELIADLERRYNELQQQVDTKKADLSNQLVNLEQERETLEQAIKDWAGLESAIAACFQAYNHPSAGQYRPDLGLPEATTEVLVQQQIQGVISGVAFSRDPIARCGHNVVIEALPGPASRVVSGQITPRRYRVTITPDDMKAGDDWRLSEVVDLPMDPNDKNHNEETSLPQTSDSISPRLIQQIAYLTRRLEQRFGDNPQDVEWTYDGEQIWVLQSRPITTLIPLWTRKIAAEVIPGVIRPLTWSINQPLTCGVWGNLFTLVLGKRALGLDFSQTAMLHRSHAYFNATLLGDIFRSEERRVGKECRSRWSPYH